MPYLHVLRRLAIVCFDNQKYEDAEKYLKIVNELVSNVTENPQNVWDAKKNLLVFYIHTNIDKAKQLGDRLLRKQESLVPAHLKELVCLVGSIHVLKEDFPVAKNMFRNVIKMQPSPALKA